MDIFEQFHHRKYLNYTVWEANYTKMFEEVQYLTQIMYEKIPTYYFYHKQSRRLITVKIEGCNAMRLYEQHPSQPPAAETIKKLVFALGVKIESIKVYLFQNNNYYTYVTVKTSGDSVDINASFIDAIELAGLADSPILFEKEIIKECGFKVTRRMIEKALLG
jgi:bifunctional DNase/RNase